MAHKARRLKVAANNLLLRGFAAHFIVDDGQTRHVHAHVRRARVRALAVNLLKHRAQHGVDFNVAVVVYSCLTVRLKVERVDHVHIIQVSRRRFIGKVHRVF